jgi:3-oxoacyl-(acyl-carrier-protein) synthase
MRKAVITGVGVVCALGSNRRVFVEGLRENFVPPTLRPDRPDPACDLDFVPLRSRPASLFAVMSNSFAFGGNNTSLVFRRVS